MKKIVTMLLVVVMVLGLAACGSKTTTETKAPTEADVSATTAAATEAPTCLLYTSPSPRDTR